MAEPSHQDSNTHTLPSLSLSPNVKQALRLAIRVLPGPLENLWRVCVCVCGGGAQEREGTWFCWHHYTAPQGRSWINLAHSPSFCLQGHSCSLGAPIGSSGIGAMGLCVCVRVCVCVCLCVCVCVCVCMLLPSSVVALHDARHPNFV